MAKKKLPIPSAKSTKPSSRGIQQQEVFAEANNPLTRLNSIEIEKCDLDELASVIKIADDASKKALMTALQGAIIAGKALNFAKKGFRYDHSVGGFRGWVQKQGLSKSSAYMYMELARHAEIVSVARTLSEAKALIAQYKASQKDSEPPQEKLKKLRPTLQLSSEKYEELEAIAKNQGVDYSDLISQILDNWLSQQPTTNTIEAEAIEES